jgi:hypothetical protein
LNQRESIRFEINSVGRCDSQRLGFGLRTLLFSAGGCALALAQSASISTAGQMNLNRN